MTLRKTRFALALTMAAGLLVPVSAYATNGYFDYGYGTKDKGMAGAGVALPQDAMAAATNPAGMAFVGNRMDLGAALFSPHRQYTASPATQSGDIAGGTYESSNNLFVIPHFGYNHMLAADSSVGVDLYGNGGMNTWYGGGAYASSCPPGTTPGAFCAGTAGVDLEQLFLSATYAQKITDAASLGISLVGVYQRFKAYGLSSFEPYSSDPSAFSDNGYSNSHGLGVRIGGLWNVGSGVSLGASYQPKITMSKFSKYAGLFANQGEFDIPANWTLGAAYAITPQQAVLFDVQQIDYSNVAAVGDQFPNGAPFGATNGPGFGWRNETVYKLGYQFATSPDWTWRVGVSHGQQPIPTSQSTLNILAPGVVENHLTGGFTYAVDSSDEVNVAAMYAPSYTVTGTNPNDPTQTVSEKMYEYELEASWGMKF